MQCLDVIQSLITSVLFNDVSEFQSLELHVIELLSEKFPTIMHHLIIFQKGAKSCSIFRHGSVAVTTINSETTDIAKPETALL